MAAENRVENVDRVGRVSGFNEAAANGRGKPTAGTSASASPRPRFNEAAANGRGKRTASAACGSSSRRLQ